MTQRSTEDDLFEAEYLAHHSDFAKGLKFGERRERQRVLKLIKRLQGDKNAIQKLYQIIEEQKEKLHLSKHSIRGKKQGGKIHD